MGQCVTKPGSTPLVRYEIEYQQSRFIMRIPSDITALYMLYAFDSETCHMNVRYIGYADK
jgi:hypothetical protein